MRDTSSSPNQQVESARRYHDRTSHTPESVRAGGHALVWEIKPSPFKLYPDLPALTLPREFPVPSRDTLRALTGPIEARLTLDRELLASVLFFSAGITRKRTYPGGGEIYFRAAASTGALYQTEVYVVAGPQAGVPAGVYHFSPGDLTLRRLREGDFRGALAAAAADERLAQVPAALALTAIYWRNTWKYQARAYRHLFWDAGTLLANALAAATALDLPAHVHTGFVDAAVNALLGLDPAREGALALMSLGAPGGAAGAAPPVLPIDLTTIPLSSRMVDYPALREAYRDSGLQTEGEVRQWQQAAAAFPTGPADAGATGAAGEAHLAGDAGRSARALTPIDLPAPRPAAGRALAETVQARGSTREFSGEAIAPEQLSDCLYHATRGFPADVPAGLIDLYVNVHAVDDIAPGAYAYRPLTHRLEPIRLGNFRRESAFLCLEQPLGGTSSATVFFLADLGSILDGLGNRGYRLANLEAGLTGGRLYLGAYAQRFGATGLTFYDRAVVEFFSPHAAGKDAVFVTALGRSAHGGPRAPAQLRIGNGGV
jgi:SagB-type dehydrogenase family enzyme